MKLTCVCAATACCLGFAPTPHEPSSSPADEPAAARKARRRSPGVPSPNRSCQDSAATEGEQSGRRQRLPLARSTATRRAGRLAPAASSPVAASRSALTIVRRWPDRQLFVDAEYLDVDQAVITRRRSASRRGRCPTGVSPSASASRATASSGGLLRARPGFQRGRVAYQLCATRNRTPAAGWRIRSRPGLELKSYARLHQHEVSRPGSSRGYRPSDERFTPPTSKASSRETDFCMPASPCRSTAAIRRSAPATAATTRSVSTTSSGSRRRRRLLPRRRRRAPLRAGPRLQRAKDSIAVRGPLSFTDASGDVAVPFYFLPRLGGSQLRGYDRRGSSISIPRSSTWSIAGRSASACRSWLRRRRPGGPELRRLLRESLPDGGRRRRPLPRLPIRLRRRPRRQPLPRRLRTQLLAVFGLQVFGLRSAPQRRT